MMPTSAPWIMKIFMIERGEEPRVRRMAMSACLSVTVITRVDTRLNAATAMIRVRMMNIMRFSVCTAANQLAFSLRPVAHDQVAGHAVLELVGHLRRLVHVGDAQAQAGRRVEAHHLFGVLDVDEGQRRIEFVVAGLEDAGHGERARARHHAGRRGLALGQQHVDLVADADAERARQLVAQHDVELARAQAV